MKPSNNHIVIIGAGIVGVSTAIWLQREGFSVTLVDKAGVAEGTSYGNGGILASCSITPVTSPGLISKAPGMLFSPDQPLFLKWGYLPKLMPWLFRYLKRANAEDAQKTAAAMMPIVGDSLNDHMALAKGTGAEPWLHESDYVFVYRDQKHLSDDQFAWDVRKAHGFEWQTLQGEEFRQYDPVFSDEFNLAVRLGGHGRISDPGRYVKALAKHFEQENGRIIIGQVDDIVRQNGEVTGVRMQGETLGCDKVVIATGAWSKNLAAKLGYSIPLESERGYHLELYNPSFQPKSPVMIVSGKFVITPMDGRIRLAGVVEFGGLNAPASAAPIQLLRKQVRAALPGLQWEDESEWLGHRPAITDSIPVIGEASSLKGAYFGFGHHHVGLTSGPKTGRLLAQLIAGRTPNLDMSMYSADRFRR